jgi:hypothetical protein
MLPDTSSPQRARAADSPKQEMLHTSLNETARPRHDTVWCDWRRRSFGGVDDDNTLPPRPMQSPPPPQHEQPSCSASPVERCIADNQSIATDDEIPLQQPPAPVVWRPRRPSKLDFAVLRSKEAPDSTAPLHGASSAAPVVSAAGDNDSSSSHVAVQDDLQKPNTARSHRHRPHGGNAGAARLWESTSAGNKAIHLVAPERWYHLTEPQWTTLLLLCAVLTIALLACWLPIPEHGLPWRT